MSSPTVPAPHDAESHDAAEESGGLGRRRFLTYLVAAPTLAVAVKHGLLGDVAHALPGTPEIADNYDLGDFLIMAQKATEAGMIVLIAQEDGSVVVDLPREEVGQGITTSVAMLVADELSLPLAKVRVVLSDARPELVWGQVTGGSNTIRSVVEPIAAASAAFRGRMAAAGSQQLGVPADRLRIQDGAVVAPDGSTVGFGELAAAAAAPSLLAPSDAAVDTPKPLVGTPQNRVDARQMVMGAFQYTNDLDPVPGALRSMVRRAPQIRGRVLRINNLEKVKALPGIVAVEVIELSRIGFRDTEVVETGVAVVAETFGQALDGKEALDVTWDPGPLAKESDATIRTKLRGINPPTTLPSLSALPLGAKTVGGEFDFAFVSHAPLESNTAIADVRPDGTAEIWAGLKTPIIAAQTIASRLGLAAEDVTVHVVQGGGSFGRRLFFDAALEAATISQRVGKPVKHMFTRIDDMRHGRARAASHHRAQFTHVGKEVLSFEHRAAFVETDWRHGLGEMLTAYGTQINPPSAVPLSAGGNATFSQSVFYLTVHSPYEVGVTTQTLNELSLPFNTAAWRSVYSPNSRGVEEVLIDELAASMGEDPAQLRLRLLADERRKAVLKKAMDLGEWGKKMAPGTAQGIAFHDEYKSMTACLVEIDVRGALPRVTRATITADYGKPINPRGLEAQLLGGLTDAIATCLRTGLHLQDGLFLEGSYSQFHFPRMKETPPEVTTFIFPETTGEPGGAGELGVAAAFGAVANAWARATGKKARTFPLVFPVDFVPFPKDGTASTRQPSNLPPRDEA